MADGSIVFVHGTGVRLKDYRESFRTAAESASKAGIRSAFIRCAWGDPLGIEWEGKCVPGPRSEKELQAESEDLAQWSALFADPLYELDKLTIRDTSDAARPAPRPGRKPEWLVFWERFVAYTPTPEFDLLLERGGLRSLWPGARDKVLTSEVAELAFERSAHELPEASGALARALVAQLYVDALDQDLAGPSRALRNSLVSRLLDDWDQKVFARSPFFVRLFKRAATSFVRRNRNDISADVALPLGDVLLYQTHGEKIRGYLRAKIANAPEPVTLVAHSLGGIACFDLLAMPNPPQVSRLVTVGSQVPLLYEMGALSSLQPSESPPDRFPPWLNIYDRDDFLSYIAEPLFAKAKDVEVESGQPFPASHSAYFGNEAVWEAILKFPAV